MNGEIKQTQQEKERPNYQTSSAPTMKAAVRAAPRAHGRVTRNNTPGILPTTEGEQRRPGPSTGESPLATSEGGRPGPSTGKGPLATSEGDRKRRKKEETDWTLTKAEQERVNEFKWKRARSSKGGRLTQTAQQTTEGGHKRARDELATNVYHILADKADKLMEVYEPTGMAFSCGTYKWSRARVKNKSIKSKA